MTDQVQQGSGEAQITTIADAVLRLKELRESNKNLNEPDIEEQFARLSLAFKTDQFSLKKRLELQKRQRDCAEKNIECELKSLRESLNALNQLCADSEMREVITKTQQHVDIVQQATMRMSSRAETYGAIQQEQRMNCAFETMLNYVEHLKLLYDKEHLELEDYKRLLAEHNLLPDEKGNIDGLDDSKRGLPPRSQSLSSSSKPVFRRRGSLGALVRANLGDGHKTAASRENATKLLVPPTIRTTLVQTNVTEVRPRLLSAVCLLNNNSDSPRSGNGLMNPSLSPKSRRCSCPVGPMSHSTQQSNLNLTILPTLPADTCVPDIIRPIPETSRREPNHDAQDCPTIENPVQGFSPNVLPPFQDSQGNKDSSPLGSSIVQSCATTPETIQSCAFHSPNCRSKAKLESTLSLLECEDMRISVPLDRASFIKFCQWSIKQHVSHWDKTILLRLRYMLSALLALAAMFSLLLTILPCTIIFR